MKLAFLFGLLFGSGLTPPEYQLAIRLQGVDRVEGQVMLAVYNQKAGFMEKEEMFKGLIFPIQSVVEEGIRITLPEGTYAISLFQDLNLDKELNTNFFGIPREPYGFSNNPKIRFGPPEFEESSFVLTSDKTIEIHLQ